MATPFIAEIRMFGFTFPPRNGQLLPINQNQALFSLLGTTYGGNGTTNFALPNLQGRTPVHTGTEIQLGQTGGETAHTLTIQEMPAHTHPVNASGGAVSSGSPALGYLTSQLSDPMFGAAAAANGNMSTPITGGGSSQPHNNMQPYTVVSFCIALTGVFPSRN